MSNQGNDGECQLEVDFEDEGDLEGRFKSCPKNPGHKKFLSLKSLQFEDLPEHHQTPCTLECIYYVAQFTVRLVIDFISPDRPCHCGLVSTSKDRQCKCLRGNVRHVGSGLVTGLAGPDQLTPDIRDSTKTYLIMVTAAHVIFDTREAQKTEIEFFYDDPHDRSSVRKAFGLRVLNTNLEADFSEVLCVTEDRVISEKFNEDIFGKTNKSNETSSPILSHRDTSEMFPLLESPTFVEKSSLNEHEALSQDLVFHISHPHGTSKKVTLGNIVSADTRDGHYQIIYTVATCRGSSGGPVFVIPANIYDINYTFKNLDSIFSVPHARHHGNELNSSSSWTVYFDDLIELMGKPKSSMKDKNYLNKNIVRLSLLDIGDLPLEYRYYHNLHLIKYMSKFTVGIHFLNDAPNDSRNMASGFVMRLADNDVINPELEDNTKTYFIMVTGAHVISDTSQAKETEINFFCDDLQDMSSVRKAFGLRVLKSYKETNVIEVLCVTKDQIISSMLKEHFLELSTSNPHTFVISKLMDYFWKMPVRQPKNFVSQFTNALNKCLTGSSVILGVARDYFINEVKEREYFLFEAYICLNTAFERLILITLFKDTDNLASHILLRVGDEVHHVTGSVTFSSYVLQYVTFLHNCLKAKSDLKDKCLSTYSNQNRMDLIETIKNASTEVSCEMMQRKNNKMTFQISHYGTKGISFDKLYVTDDMRATNRWYKHNNSPVFTIRSDVINKADEVESNASGITSRLYDSELYQSVYEWSNEKCNRVTITFPHCDIASHLIRLWADQL